MFTCFQTRRGSGHKKAKSGNLSRFWRWLIRPLTNFRHASHREPKVCPPNEQEPDSLAKRPEFNYNSPDYIDQMVHYIPAAIQNSDHKSISTFLDIYPEYASTLEVLDLLRRTYPWFRPESAEDQKNKSAIFSFLLCWFEKFPQDFYHLAIVRQFIDYVNHCVPSLEGETQAWELLSLLEDLEDLELKTEDDWAMTPEPPEQDACGRQETLAPRPASVTELEGDVQPGEDSEPVKRAVLDPFEPKAAIELLPTLDQALPTSAHIHSPVDVAADEAADVSTARQSFRSYTVQLGTPDFVFPLPEVDI